MESSAEQCVGGGGVVTAFPFCETETAKLKVAEFQSNNCPCLGKYHQRE